MLELGEILINVIVRSQVIALQRDFILVRDRVRDESTYLTKFHGRTAAYKSKIRIAKPVLVL